MTLEFLSEVIKETAADHVEIGGTKIPRYTNEFWTAKQRQASSIHEVSYRACFKPQLPRFFIGMLTLEDDIVYDPFCGRGTTVLEAGLMGRRVIYNDINPLGTILARPRFFPPPVNEVRKRLQSIPLNSKARACTDLSMFYHPDTEAEIVSLKEYLHQREINGEEDDTDMWIRMVATNRLTGHSPGFFSVYTLPPNQAVSPERQVKINMKRNQSPPYRNTKEIVLRKTERLLRNIGPEDLARLKKAGQSAQFFNRDARSTPGIPAEAVQLTVTSPPFLNVVQYSNDNWLRCWFNTIDNDEVAGKITMASTVEEWSVVMGKTLKELFRITRPGGWVAFEVGEVKKGSLKLDECVVLPGLSAGFECGGIIINSQEFTKTSNIWGINNNSRGTNSNRIVIFHKV